MLTRNSILQQASISMLAQANMMPQSALALLQ
jgi:flagellin-like hook-associated protein FlgL